MYLYNIIDSLTSKSKIMSERKEMINKQKPSCFIYTFNYVGQLCMIRYKR